jgi:hypothetical protein
VGTFAPPLCQTIVETGKISQQIVKCQAGKKFIIPYVVYEKVCVSCSAAPHSCWHSPPSLARRVLYGGGGGGCCCCNRSVCGYGVSCVDVALQLLPRGPHRHLPRHRNRVRRQGLHQRRHLQGCCEGRELYVGLRRKPAICVSGTHVCALRWSDPRHAPKPRPLHLSCVYARLLLRTT